MSSRLRLILHLLYCNGEIKQQRQALLPLTKLSEHDFYGISTNDNGGWNGQQLLYGLADQRFRTRSFVLVSSFLRTSAGAIARPRVTKEL